MWAAHPMRRQSLVEFFSEYTCHGNDTAFTGHRGYRTNRWGYQQIVAGARRFARELEGRIGKGDAVLVWAENSPEWAIVFWGCLLRGAVVVPIDRISTSEFSSRVAQQVSAKILIYSHGIPHADLNIPHLAIESLVGAIAHHSDAKYASPQLSRQDVLEIVFTSGTTAEPRGVVITHGNVLANIEPLEQEIKKYLRYERIFHPLRFLNLLPLSHIFGQMLALFIAPMLGAHTIFLESLRPAELLETIHRERVSVLIAVPRLIESLQREIQRQMEGPARIQKFRKDFEASQK